MPADILEIVNVLMNPSVQLRTIGDEIGTAAIAQIEGDDRAAGLEILEIVKQRKSIEDDQHLRSAADLLIKKPNTVVDGDIAACQLRHIQFSYEIQQPVPASAGNGLQLPFSSCLKKQKPRTRGLFGFRWAEYNVWNWQGASEVQKT